MRTDRRTILTHLFFIMILISSCNKFGDKYKEISTVTAPDKRIAPDAPTALSITDNKDFSSQPSIEVEGVTSGDTVRLFTDSKCTAQTGNDTNTTASTILINASNLTGGVYNFYANITNKNGTSNCSSATVSYEKVDCPTGFVWVPSNSTLGINRNFCVMKYEAKCSDSQDGTSCNDANDIPVSQADNAPWRSTINATEAYSACARITQNGYDGTFALISNAEWMTIARNIENVASNWSGGSVGSGNLVRGWSANSDDDGFQNNTVAPAASSTCLYNTDANICGPTGTHRLRRTSNLSNGNIIWDLAGDVWSFVDWSSSDNSFTTAPTDSGSDSSWHELNNLLGSITINDLQPAGGYTSSQQAGCWQPYNSGGATRRGGIWNYGDVAGIFTLALAAGTSYNNENLGFRCVYRIE